MTTGDTPIIQLSLPPTTKPTYAIKQDQYTAIKPIFGDTATAPPTSSGLSQLEPQIYIVPKDPSDPAVDPTADPILPICNKCTSFAFYLAEDETRYCQTADDKCWSRLDCTGAGNLCQVGVNWELPANQVREAPDPSLALSSSHARTRLPSLQHASRSPSPAPRHDSHTHTHSHTRVQCKRPIDALVLLDESASISDAEWVESLDFIKKYAVAMNGGATGGRIGLGADQVRISVVHWADNGQQSMGVPFRFSTNLNGFVAQLGGLSRQYIGNGCPVKVLKWSAHYAICTSDVTNANFNRCNNTMNDGALVHATQSASNPPVIQNPETGVIGIATKATTTKAALPLVRGRRLLQKTAAIATSETQYPVLVPTQCCKTCFEGKACGDTCINANHTCKALTGCACDAIPTAGKLFMAGQYVLAKQGLAAVRPPPITHDNNHTSCGCVSLATPTECIYVMTNLQDLAGETKTCKAYCKSRSDSNTECGYTYGEYSAELGFRSNANGGATVVVVATDGNPALASECGITDTERNDLIANFKPIVDRLIPVGIGSFVNVGTLLTFSHQMPVSMPYITTSFGTLASALDVLATLSCPTQAPTAPPTKLPTRSPTTAKPTAVPTAVPGCTAEEWNACDKINGQCVCADGECSKKECLCNDGFGCSDLACGTCTIAPTLAPTFAPTLRPTIQPTAATGAPSDSPTKSPTKVPTMMPTFSQSCNPIETAKCDVANGGTCSADGAGGHKCTCPAGWGCTNADCGTCTIAPTNAPTVIPTRAPTAEPSAAPTGAPSKAPTAEPSRKPTYQFGCSTLEKANCDSAVGICYCADAVCTSKKCGCPEGWGCTSTANDVCGTCTAAPSHAPTMEPSASPSSSPTVEPTY